jgi:hypothetical protein
MGRTGRVLATLHLLEQLKFTLILEGTNTHPARTIVLDVRPVALVEATDGRGQVEILETELALTAHGGQARCNKQNSLADGDPRGEYAIHRVCDVGEQFRSTTQT